MGNALLVNYYQELPDPRRNKGDDWEGRLETALDEFKHKVEARYSEGTLHRLLKNGGTRARRAAVLALGLLGSCKTSNSLLARALHDSDRVARQLASDALWSLWFRADSEENNQELQRLLGLRDRARRLAGLSSLINRAPQFAEALNQRAIVHFQAQRWQEAILDCEKVLKLNQYHFGAAAGMGHCYMELGRNRAALRAFRQALRINPALDDVAKTIQALESALGGEGRKDDKK